MFIRIKKIKGNSYAYLVENLWRKRKKYKVKQKTLKYLGKIIKLEKKNNVGLQEFLNQQNPEDYLKKENPKRIVTDLIKKELINHEFKETKRNVWEYNAYKIDLKNKNVLNKNTKREICFEVNNNFLCSYTLRKLINFAPKENLTDLQIGRQLANTFESAGILVPRDIFVIVAKKIIDEIKKS